MKKRALVSLVLLVSILMVMAETVIFQEGETDPAHCVDGHVYVWNSQNGQWDASSGERLFVKIYNASNPAMYQQYDWPVTGNAYYLSDFSGTSSPEEYNTVKVVFRGQTYVADFCYATGTTVDIWFYPDR